jgi:hypothetical protein
MAKSVPVAADRSLTIPEFCALEQISESSYYKLKAAGLGPQEYRFHSIVRITPQARLDWQRARENPVGVEAKEVQRTAAKLKARGQAAIKRSIQSPKRLNKQRRKAPHAVHA